MQSRARKDNFVESDVDIIVVSDKFEGMKWPRRLEKVSLMWTGNVDIEPLCYTKKEFEKKKKQIGIIQHAITEGIELI